jgi:hypothetical protein
MTIKEHKLIVSMLATQLKMYADLINTLRDNGTLKSADLSALQKAAHIPEDACVSAVRVQYVAHAKILGLDLDLPEA